MFGGNYSLIQTCDSNGNQVEKWVLDGQPMPKIVIDPAVQILANGRNTDKDKYVRKTKIAGVNIVSRPCGIILSMEELYGCESLSQVLLPIHALMKTPSIKKEVKGKQVM